MKKQLQRRAVAQPASSDGAGAARPKPGLAQLKALADASAAVASQRSAQRRADGRTVQRAADEEELMQGKAMQLQSADEEELMQGKAMQLQSADEEELMQGKAMQLQSADEEELMQGKALQRQTDEEEPLQGKSAQRVEAAPTAAGGSAASGSLPQPLRSGVEQISGMAMDDVQVHYGSAEPAKVGAMAYAQGQDIHLGPGQERHLPHEAWHVVQQAQGRVRPTTQAFGVSINDNPALEREADTEGARALSAVATADTATTASET